MSHTIQHFFDFMKERHSIYRRRFIDKKPAPWTHDPIFREYRFTNVYRELDATTIWFRENVRDRLEDPRDILFATILFRWFNRIETGEALLMGGIVRGLPGENDTANPSLFEVQGYDKETAEYILRPLDQWVTGSYIIKTPDGMDKLQGVLWCVDNLFKRKDFSVFSDWLNDILFQIEAHRSLEKTHECLIGLPYLGYFMAYEIVTDLRHTPLLRNASDIMTWANPGPGAMRGINRILGDEDIKKKRKRKFYIEYMQKLLQQSNDIWPNNEEFPPLEMRDIEHSLCEFDKYLRVKNGEGRPRQKFRSGTAS